MLSLKSKLNHLSSEYLSDLENIVRKIVETGKAEIVILFGHFALASQQKAGNLPYEILVITDHHETREELSLELGGAFKDHNPRVSGVIETITFVNINLEQGLFYFSDILREGIIIYDSGEFALSKTIQIAPSKRRKLAEADYKEWISKAKQSWDHFIESEASTKIQSAAFFLNQVVEYCYTTIEMVFSHNHYEEHNIKAQRDRIRAFNKRIHEAFPLVTNEERSLFEELSKAYVSGRYISAEDFQISKDALNYWAGEAKKLLIITTEVCLEKIQRLKVLEKKIKSQNK